MRIADLMATSGVKFGTSGARGLVAAMTDRVCYGYTRAFLQYLASIGQLSAGAPVGIAGDLRASTPRIMAACARAIADSGARPRYFGRIPTPALAAHGMAVGMPTLMITGSHIPDDRNGIKFNRADGEILKADEVAIGAQDIDLDAELFDAADCFADGGAPLPDEERLAFDAYVRRFLDFFPPGCLTALRIGLYEHSSVARDALYEVLTGLGARVERLGFSERFMPVDTEAIRQEDVALARDWCADGRYDALVSADGDGDRPLISDEHGTWLRGDMAGVLCARALGARAVATPVSSNTAVERSGWFDAVSRTRIGSPYVIEGMRALAARGLAPVVGYEANGGFLLGSPLRRDSRLLPALPTRDALLPIIAILGVAAARGRSIAALSAELPRRFTHSDRLQNIPIERGAALLAALTGTDDDTANAALEAFFGAAPGDIEQIEQTDGIRVIFANGEIAHLRPSGNAPELRAYTEADSPSRALELNAICMARLRHWRQTPAP